MVWKLFLSGDDGFINSCNATIRYRRHQNKVKVKGLGRNSSISWLKILLRTFLSSIETKVAIKFPKLFFFPAKNRLGAERVENQISMLWKLIS